MRGAQGIILVVIVVIGMVMGGYLLNGGTSSTSATATPGVLGAEVDASTLYNDSAPLIGNKDAKVKLVIFSDFLCPYCKEAHSVLNTVLSSSSDVSVEYRNLIVHSDSQILAQAAEAANLQGKYKEMSDALFSETVGTNEDAVIALAKKIGLDVTKFKSDLNSAEVKNKIEKDNTDGTTLQLQGTPSIFLNGKEVSNFTQLQDLVNQNL